MNKIEEGFKQIIKIQYSFESNIESIVENSENKLVVTFKDDNTWIDLYSKLFSVEFVENSKEEDAGIIYEQRLSFEIQGDKEEVNSEFNQVKGRELIILIVYDDGSSKLLGGINNPCFIAKDFYSKPLDTLHTFYINKEDYRPSMYLNS